MYHSTIRFRYNSFHLDLFETSFDCEKNFVSNHTLNLKNFEFGQLSVLVLEFIDIKFPLVTIKVSDFPITFTKLKLFFIEPKSSLGMEDLFEALFGQKKPAATPPVDDGVKIVVTKLSASVRNCRITASKGERIRLVQED
ncbi:unnamed protein product [Ambrosiozyma monospora]|uniref:Unnamed protein product n=1 Tax=Ambrosiozyma monospora TaxID=43982 RepID=A0ACB5UA30_AMBMO|nr:unnamed protein product [Ambrosiozyma monospora]